MDKENMESIVQKRLKKALWIIGVVLFFIGAEAPIGVVVFLAGVFVFLGVWWCKVDIGLEDKTSLSGKNYRWDRERGEYYVEPPHHHSGLRRR